MSSVAELSRLVRVDLREAWPNEALNFTPWLAQEENLGLLSETLGLELELEAVEKSVESFSADILAKDGLSGGWVLIENQLEQTDHNHLGQILTYAAGLNASTVVWIAKEFRDPHRAAIDYLNEISSPEHNFFGVQLELYRIGASPFAPRFSVVAKPNDWSKRLVARTKDSPSLAAAKQEWADYWARFFSSAPAEILPLANRTPPKEGWCRVAQLRSGDPGVSVWLHHSARLRALVWIQGTLAKPLFDLLQSDKDNLARAAGAPLVWDRMNNKKSCMIHTEIDAAALPDEPAQFEWFARQARAIADAFRPVVDRIDKTQLQVSPASEGS